MDAEERHILPVYRVLLRPVPGGDPDLFLLEHQNILRNLASAKEALRKVIGNVLYPRLDAALTEGEREKLLAAVSR